MQKRIAIPVLFIGLFLCGYASAQVKIGDNPQTIDPASVLELESTERVLVITRVDSIQMSNITPNRGALVYNTSADCVFYYNGTDWINLCGSDGAIAGFTTDPIVNDQATIVITPTPTGGNIEIAESSINSSQIIDGGINGVDIQNGSIGRGKLQNNSVDRTKLAENSVGPFAIDNDSIDLADFNNITGFIRDTDLAALEASVATNTADIAADGDTDAGNEIQTLTFNPATNILTLSDSGGTVNLSSLDDSAGGNTVISSTTTITVTGAGTIASPFELEVVGGTGGDDDQNAAEVPVAATPVNYIAATQDVEAHLAGIDDALASGGGGGTTEEVDGATLTGNGTAADPFTIAPGTDGQFLSTNVDGDVVWAGLPPSGATALFDATTISGTGVTDDEYTVADDAITSVKIADAAITLADLNDNGATTDGEIMQWNTTANDGAGGWIVTENAGGLTGASNSLFFAGADGTPVTTETSASTLDEGGLFWDPAARFDSGALFIGLKKNHPEAASQQSNNSKVVIAERPPLSLGTTYPLQLVNESGENGATAGILFSVEDLGTFGKGGLVYERTESWARGDFHFLQNQEGNATESKPTLADKAFTIKNNGDIVLYGGLEANGALGTAGQVLTSTGTGTEWGDSGGGGGTAITDTDVNDGLSDFSSTTGYDVNVDDITIELATDALQIKNGGITLEKLNQMGATDGQILKWNQANTAWEPAEDNAGSTAFTGGEGLTLNGDDFSVNVDDTTIEIDTDILSVKDGGVTDLKLDKANIPLSGFGASTENVALGGFTITDLAVPILDQDAATKKYVDDNAGGHTGTEGSLFFAANTSGVPTENNAQLFWNATLNRLGVGNNSPDSKLEVTGETRSTSFASAQGTAGEPAYSFTTGEDTNTGMYRPAADQLGFSVGGFEALRIEETSIGINKIVVNQSLELVGPIIDFNGAIGDPGNVLKVNATGDGVEWSIEGGGTTVVTNTDKITGNGSATAPLTIANNAITTAELDIEAVTTTEIAPKTILSGNIGDGEIKPINIENESIDTDLLENLGVKNDDIGPEAVTTDKIANRTIVDININDDAAIDGLKINPNFGPQVISTTGNIEGDVITATGDLVTLTGSIFKGALDLHPDYVFQKYFLGNSELKKSYHFASLDEIERFVKKYHHLPGIKSAAQVKKEGVWDLGASNLQNLEKIEELFLHTIEQEKKIEQLQSEKEVLSDEVKALRNDLDEIKAMLKKSE